MWKEILFKVLDGINDIPSPFASNTRMEHVFVVMDEVTRMGFLWIWCPVTLRGINMSRMKVPEDVEFINIEEFDKLNIPVIKFEAID
ncbi:hypothetical protein [Chitinophaga sp. CB10]|uniref:hypothetical protein n=1 Tax=Chitinophaga sp. CB10 TaxID=1891659 RepID=UPI0025BA74C2|nr:hypothetical protein [Chitinophaga sp. CB10]